MRILLLLLSSALILLLTSLEVVDGYRHACEVVTKMKRDVRTMKESIKKIELKREAAQKIVDFTSGQIESKKKQIEGQYKAIKNQRAGIERRSRRRRSGSNRNKKLCDD